jgi:hypothetical protein
VKSSCSVSVHRSSELVQQLYCRRLRCLGFSMAWTIGGPYVTYLLHHLLIGNFLTIGFSLLNLLRLKVVLSHKTSASLTLTDTGSHLADDSSLPSLCHCKCRPHDSYPQRQKQSRPKASHMPGLTGCDHSALDRSSTPTPI